jgi:hypothetical protein
MDVETVLGGYGFAVGEEGPRVVKPFSRNSRSRFVPACPPISIRPFTKVSETPRFAAG